MYRFSRFFSTASPQITSSLSDRGILTLTLNQGGAVNTLSSTFTKEISGALTDAVARSDVKAIIIDSAKKGCFIAGADIGELSGMKSPVDLANLARAGQKMLVEQVQQCPKPIVAAIDGVALGGGLELALACTSRIATPRSSLGLPEVMLGLLPAAGGTTRLPKLLGLQAALPLLLTGKKVNGTKARKLGLVDNVADPFALSAAAEQQALALVEGSGAVRSTPAGLKGVGGYVDRVLTSVGPARNFALKKAREQVMKQTGGKMPAPLAILRVVEAGLVGGFDAGLEAEATHFGSLGFTPESRALVSIFNGQTALKKSPVGAPKNPVQRVGVVGAGLMGAGIATVSAAKGFPVVLRDTSEAGLARGLAQIDGVFAGKVKRRQLGEAEAARAAAAVVGTADPKLWRDHMATTDLVIEAVFEDLKVKHAVIADLEAVVSKDAVIATNTSALPIRDVARGARHPERILGMHYFSPVDKMPLLEIITHEGTSKEAVARAFRLGSAQGKTVIVVKDVPGFYVNRCLGPYMAEGMALLAAGVDPLAIDRALKSFGFPVGPITLIDEVGVDVASHVNSFLSKDLGVRMAGSEAGLSLLASMLEKDLKGRKSGEGFFVYGKGNKSKELSEQTAAMLPSEKVEMDDETIVDRMILRFVNEAALCVQEGIVASETDADIGAVFGIGFPPFLGGPMRYARETLGFAETVRRMEKYRSQLGEQFAPCDYLVNAAKQ